MEKSTVYFTDFRCPVGTSQLDKLKKTLCCRRNQRYRYGWKIRSHQDAFRRAWKYGIPSSELCKGSRRSL